MHSSRVCRPIDKMFSHISRLFFSFFGKEPNSCSRSKLGNPDNVSRGYTSQNSNFLGSATAGTARLPRQVGINPVEVMVVVHPPAQEMKRSFPFNWTVCCAGSHFGAFVLSCTAAGPTPCCCCWNCFSAIVVSQTGRGDCKSRRPLLWWQPLKSAP